MALLAAGLPTLLDWAKTRDPNGSAAKVIELLSQTNSILDDMGWMEGNLPTGHRTTQRTGIAAASFRAFNEGTQATKNSNAQVTDTCAMLDAWGSVDAKLAELEGDLSSFRLTEAMGHLEGMNQKFATTLIYGDTTSDPKAFTGFAPRYNLTTGVNGENIVNAGGSGVDNSSIWLVCWSPLTAYGIFPKGSKGGIVHEDLGMQTLESTGGVAGALSRVYQDHWEWNCGLTLRDWRYAVRGANIDISNLVAESSNADLIKLMIKMIHRLPSMNVGKPVFYMNRTVFEFLDIQRLVKAAGAGLSYADVDGKSTPVFRGIPVRIVDAITNAEATVL